MGVGGEVGLADPVAGALLPGPLVAAEETERDDSGLAHRLDNECVVAGRCAHLPATVMPSMRTVGASTP